MVTQACSGLPLFERTGGRGGAKDGDNSGRRALPIRPTNWTEPRATALTKVELSLTNLKIEVKLNRSIQSNNKIIHYLDMRAQARPNNAR